MNYQIIEKTIYSEADLLHFGEKEIFGDIVNEYFPDYSGTPVGDVIFESENIEAAKAKKEQLEIQRLRTSAASVNPFFDDDELAETFYSSENFSKLQEFYSDAFNLELVRRTHNEMVAKNGEFIIPAEATNEQVLEIQRLLGLYFFEIKEAAF